MEFVSPENETTPLKSCTLYRVLVVRHRENSSATERTQIVPSNFSPNPMVDPLHPGLAYLAAKIMTGPMLGIRQVACAAMRFSEPPLTYCDRVVWVLR